MKEWLGQNDTTDRRFLLANAQVEHFPIIYTNDGFCELVGYSRAELMQRPATCDFLHGPLTSSQAAHTIRESLDTCLEKQLEIIYYRKDGTKFLCSQVTAPIKNEDGEISMFIMNFEDITDAPYRDEVITPCTSPLMSARSKSLRLWLPSLLRRGSESRGDGAEDDMMLTPPDAEALAMDTFDPRLQLLKMRRQSSLAEVTHQDHCCPSGQQYGCQQPLQNTADALWRASSSFKEKGTLSAAIAANNLSKSLPNASSDSDLSRVRQQQQRKSPSLSNVISESHSRQKENNSAKLLLKEMHSHKLYMGEKVAQEVLFLLRRGFRGTVLSNCRNEISKVDAKKCVGSP
ncbi:hypothetical protein JTE90_000207 [Oedothorax gibbosus]|uniref:LOV domain-containing protein n=1 Tax=Oedothorax gibbosus TaxID=931172 RepID=A0AAV6VC58_9ARAC|nr:hypothetical protein JTE90_000207 [Oedothorax gibbosus]